MTWDYAEISYRVGSAALAMDWAQWLILLTGPTAIGLSQIESTKRWACIVGLTGQAGWFAATWKANQWGMFAASFVYAGMWCIGFWRHWMSPWVDAILTGPGPADTAGPTSAITTKPRRPSLRVVGGKEPPPRLETK